MENVEPEALVAAAGTNRQRLLFLGAAAEESRRRLGRAQPPGEAAHGGVPRRTSERELKRCSVCEQRTAYASTIRWIDRRVQVNLCNLLRSATPKQFRPSPIDVSKRLRTPQSRVLRRCQPSGWHRAAVARLAITEQVWQCPPSEFELLTSLPSARRKDSGQSAIHCPADLSLTP
jgi:hypothetical protein